MAAKKRSVVGRVVAGGVGIALLLTACADDDLGLVNESELHQDQAAELADGTAEADVDHETVQSDAATSDASSDDSDDTPVEDDDTSSPGPSLSRTARQLSAVAVYPDGTRIRFGVEIGRPVAPASLDGGGLSACSVNEERDVVIPALVTATPVTTGFTYTVQAGIASLAAPGQDAEIWGELHSGRAEGSCEGGSGGSHLVGANWGETRPDDEGDPPQYSGRFSILVRDYYSPAHPDGNDELLGGIALQFLTGNDSLGGEATSFEEATGSGGVLWNGLPVLPLVEPHGFDEAEQLPSP